MRPLPRQPRSGPRSGVAILTVLLVLLALLVLCAPFLMTTRNAAKASAQLADAAQARLALDSAARYARSQLSRSHPSVDPTLWADSEDELRLSTELDRKVLDPHDPLGVMWGAEAGDVAAQIDLNSAPPQVFANLLALSTRLNETLESDGEEIVVASTAGFPPQGFLWIGRELIAYAERASGTFKGLQRGVGAALDGAGEPLPCGPQPASSWPPGTPVLEQRAWAPVLWRCASSDGELRRFDAPEQLRESARLALSGLDEETLRVLEGAGSVYAGVRSGPRWQRGARLLNQVEGGRGCELVLDDARWFNPGTTVQISDGQTTELGVVQELTESGVLLTDPLANDYLALSAVVRPQMRTAVNANSASAATLEVLFANLQLARVNSRITREEARALAGLLVESRPFTGFEDFLRRVVLPAAGLEALPDDAPLQPAALPEQGGGGLISAEDAFALYVNALNANDSRLAYSTLPLCFTTRDVYALDLRAAVNAPSGVERAAARREEIELVVPQRDPLLQVWARQEDFDEALRLSREAPLWATGPSATSPGDDDTAPPSRARAHFGAWADGVYDPARRLVPAAGEEGTAVEHVFASREDVAWAQLAPARVDETGLRRGRVLHFDHETRDIEGRFLPDGSVLRRTTDPLVAWTPGSGELLRALDLSLWIEPRALGDGVLVDVGRSSLETDRVALLLEGPDLGLRVLDAAGDHPESTLREAGEARYAIQPLGTLGGAGLEPDTWTHVSIDVAGTRPDQITFLVDGQAHGVRTLGRSRLAAAFFDGATQLSLEDDEGFPDRGVVRIGNELVEYVRAGKNLLDCARITSGENAGFGGRIARVDFELTTTDGQEPGTPTVLGSQSYNTNHGPGTAVQLYGYSLPLEGNVSPARGSLSGKLGVFAVGRIESVVGGATPRGDRIEVTVVTPFGPFDIPLGLGMGGVGSTVTGLVLQPADPGLTQQQVLDAFSPSGGFAAIVQTSIGNVRLPNGNSGSGSTSAEGDPVGGVEIVRYSGHDGTTLFLAGRAALPAAGGQAQIPHAFVAEWAVTINGEEVEGLLGFEAFVVPISLATSGAQSSLGFPVNADGSEYAQITHFTDAELTEWVRYDTVVGDQLVRSDPDALRALEVTLTGAQPRDVEGPPLGPGGGPGDVGPLAGSALLAALPVQQGQGGMSWSPFMQEGGSALDESWPVTYAARTALQFRGVAGTYPQQHPVGTPVLPTFRVGRGGADGGIPGRHDLAFLLDGERAGVGFPVHVHRAYRPNEYRLQGFTGNGANPEMPLPGAVQVALEDSWLRSWTWVALQDAAPIPFVPDPGGTKVSPYETRELARLVLHPSGERPRVADRVVIGGSIRGGEVPPAVVDEIVFGSTALGEGTPEGGAIQGGQLVLTTDLAPGGTGFQVAAQALRVARGIYGNAGPVLAQLPQDAGLLRIGSEIVCYALLDSASGSVGLANGGRGLLGTTEEYHEAGETVTFLEGWTVSLLAGGAGASAAALPLLDNEDFPPHGALVRLGDELVHYTYLNGAVLEMPRLSSEPGRMDRRGAGLFRGRFGTTPQAHGAGTPVILHPYRYCDRWADRADAPELAYFGFVLDQPSAFWRSIFFEAEEPSSGAARVNLLQRVTPHDGLPPRPWDDDPGATRELELFEEGSVEDEGNRIGLQADRVEWRAFVRYSPGAFDPSAGASHGWKQTPRLRLLGVEYLAPSVVLRRVER